MSEKFEEINIAGKIPVNILLFRRHKHNFEHGWETEYLSELADTLKPGMVVYDIGAENAEFTAMAAKVVGGANVHIFEPSPDYWPNIKAIWDANNFENPGGCLRAYVDSKSVIDFLKLSNNYWPQEINSDIFYGTNQVLPSSSPCDSISIDLYSDYKKVSPDLIMIDIEGAELSAIMGSKKVIEKHSPIFFISIHSDELINQRPNGSKKDIHDFFNSNGYKSIHISTDHEEHWKFYK